nr:putative ribonuclease H-like domain-containing protein [Tanacetum cinerariifolium]
MPITSVEDMAHIRLEVKARSTLMMGIPNKNQLKFNSIKDAKQLMEAIEKIFGGNAAIKKTQWNLLKQQYENFTASNSNMLDQTFDRLQKLMSQLELLDEKISQEDVFEPEVKGMSSSNSSTQNMAFLSSSNNNSTNGAVNTAQVVNTTNGVSTAGTQVNIANIVNLSDAVICAFLASQPSSPQLVNEDLEQIHPDDLEEIDLKWQMAIGHVAFGGNPKGGKITGKGTIKTGELDFENMYFVKELKFNLFVSQMYDKKNTVLFNDTECVVLYSDFKLTDENHVLLRVPIKNNMYSVDLKNVIPKGGFTCYFAKATSDESRLWHRRLGHLNFKTMNKLVKGNLVRGLPLKKFENDQTRVACQKGKQHRASCKSKTENSISLPLHMLHMDLFGLTFVKSLMKKMHCLVVTDDYSRFTWVFFLSTKNETSGILKSFITRIENLVDHKVKVIRCDNRTEFKNKDMNQFCKMKGIMRQYSVARTPQQNGVDEKRDRTLIEATKTMLADSKLPTTFYAEAVSTACYVLNRAKAVNTGCYVQNRVLVTKPHKKTPYELFHGRTPMLSFMRPFGYPITILNTIDHLGTFDGKADEGFFVGYSLHSKAFRVFIRYKDNNHVGQVIKEKELGKDYILLPLWTADPPFPQKPKSSQDAGFKPSNDVGKKVNEVQDKKMNATIKRRRTVLTALTELMLTPMLSFMRPFGYPITILNTIDHLGTFDGKADEGFFVGYSLHSKAFRVFIRYKDNNHVGQVIKEKELGKDYILLPLWTADPPFPQKPKSSQDAGFKPSNDVGKKVNEVQDKKMNATIKRRRTVKSSIKLPNDPNMPELEDISIFEDSIEDVFGVEADLNNLESTFQGHTQEEGIDYDEVFAPVASIEAIMMFLAYASFKDFVVYQMDVKSAFLYGKIKEEVYVCQPLGFEDPDFPDKVYKVEKSLYGLHQSPRACDYARASLDRKSTTGGCQFLGCRLISWQCKKQTVVENSKIEAEYVVASSCCCQMHALVDGMKVIITESSVRRDLQSVDEDGIDCLLNTTIFENLALMGYEKRIGKGFSGKETLLFPTMVGPNHVQMGEGSAQPTDTQHTPTFDMPPPKPQKTQKPRQPKRKTTKVPQPSGSTDIAAYKDVHKEGGKIYEIDADEYIALVSTHNDMVQDEGIKDGEEEVVKVVTTAKMLIDIVVDAAQVATAIVDVLVSTAETIVTTALTITVESTKINVKVQDKGKGKAKLIEEPVKLKKKDQILFDEEVARKLQEEIYGQERLAKVDVDYQLAERLQAEKQEQLTDAEKAKLFMDFMEKRRKFFAAKRTTEKRNKPPTKAQQRKLLDKAMDRINNFIDFRTELVEVSTKKDEAEIAQERSSKRVGDEHDQERSK